MSFLGKKDPGVRDIYQQHGLGFQKSGSQQSISHLFDQCSAAQFGQFTSGTCATHRTVRFHT